MGDVTIAALPDALLGRVLELAYGGERRWRTAGWQSSCHPALAVSRTWRRAFLSTPALWRHVTLEVKVTHPSWPPAQRQQWFARQLALLQHVAAFVECATVQEGSEAYSLPVDMHAETVTWLASCMSLLLPAQLRRLQIVGSAALLPAVLPQPQQPHLLRELEVLGNFDLLRPAAASAILQLSQQLSSLVVHVGSTPPLFVDSLSQLVSLTQLQLETQLSLPPSLQHLTALSRLQHLRLAEGYTERAEWEDGLYLHILDANEEAEDVRDSRLLPAPSRFPELRRFGYSSVHGIVQIAGVKTERCCTLKSADLRQPKGAALLQLQEVSHLRSLPALLHALAPPGVPINCLDISNSHLPLAALVSHCEPLAALTELRLVSVTSDGGLEGLFGTLLPRMPDLAALRVTNGLMARLPAIEAAGQHSPTRLELGHNCLDDLPPGEYLAGLQELDLSFNRLDRLPAALSAATALTALDLSGNSLLLSAADAEEVLSRLHHLRHLRLWGCSLQELPTGSYFSGLQQLEHLDLSSNELIRLPEALESVTALRKLRLSNNPCLTLAPADVCTLLRLPRLEQLEFGHTNVSLAVVEQLQHAAPQLRMDCHWFYQFT